MELRLLISLFYFAAYVNVGAVSQLGQPVSIKMLLCYAATVFTVPVQYSSKNFINFGYHLLVTTEPFFPITLVMVFLADGALLSIDNKNNNY